MNTELEKILEAVLFWRGEPMTLPELCRALKLPSVDVKKGLQSLKEKLQGRGLSLIQTEDEYAFATAPDTHELIERLRKEELARDLGKAALETLSIVLYKERVSRRDIEYIRGVNSTAILRSLLIRGLIERRQSEDDERVFLYRPTIDLLSLLGISSFEELPEFKEIRTELSVAQTTAVAAETPLDDEDEN
ncbi:MAG: Segregation and condensation protein B [Parcubacteria group bacterium GW2011_GWA2_49_9]|nr:MAG: Segregation and condensation protein B [Parcubacteria group bacterium GW2011_GWA2_49_9]